MEGNEVTQKTREEHVEWCKQRAREYLDQDDAPQAIASMVSDLNKHSETQNMGFVAPLMIAASMEGTIGAARRFIEGFN